MGFMIIELILMIALFVVSKYSVKHASNKWRLLYAVPVFVAVAAAIFSGFDAYHAGVYLASALPLLCLFFEESKVRPKQVIASACAVIIVANIVFVSVAPNYHRVAYLEDFEQGFQTMKEYYVLSKEKGIDWDALYAKYRPVFEEVDETQDGVGNYKAWQRFTGEFFDGHVAYQPDKVSALRDAVCRSYGNDFGMSLARTSAGEYVAINVEGYANSYSVMDSKEDEFGFYAVKDKYMPDSAEDDRLTLKDAGIRNGTVITKWNGKEIEAYFDEVEYYFDQYPVRENEEFYLPMYVAGIGQGRTYGDTYVPTKKDKESPVAVISFLDENGVEQSVTAPNLGSYAARLYHTFHKLDDGLSVTNLNWQEASADTYVLRVSEMSYDQQSYDGTVYDEVTDRLREEVLSLKEVGVQNLIIDLRSNLGGSPFFVSAVAKIFAPKGEYLTYYNAVINEKTGGFERDADGRYQMGTAFTYEGEDLWHDGKITLLVNAMTVSAGDDMTYAMGDFPNVTVTGFTRSNSSCQAVNSEQLSQGVLSFSCVPNLLPNGEIAIDTYADHVGRTPFDEYIPFDEKAIKAIFDEGEDYLLSYCTDFH